MILMTLCFNPYHDVSPIMMLLWGGGEEGIGGKGSTKYTYPQYALGTTAHTHYFILHKIINASYLPDTEVKQVVMAQRSNKMSSLS